MGLIAAAFVAVWVVVVVAVVAFFAAQHWPDE